MIEASEPGLRRTVSSALIDSIAESVRAHHPETRDHRFGSAVVKNESFQTILVQLRALGIVIASTKKRSLKDQSNYWTLTPYGNSIMMRLRALKRPDVDQ